LNTLTPPVYINRVDLDGSPSGRSPLSARSGRFSGPLSTPLSELNLEDKNHPLDLDNSDELAIRALLLGINYRTTKKYEIARGFLKEAYEYQPLMKTSTWVGGVAMFELAVLDLKEAEEVDRFRATTFAGGAGPSAPSPGPSPLKASMTIDTEVANVGVNIDRLQTPKPVSEEEKKTIWIEALKSASSKLDAALGLATSSVDLSSRLDSRIAILRDEIAIKKGLLQVTL
jgi:uncharacterized small protein (DUF1192 family)